MKIKNTDRKTNKMLDKKKIKEKIEEFEYLHNGMGKLSGTSVEVKNIRIKKDLIVCDVTLNFDMNDRSETYRNCEYPLDRFMVK